MAKATGDNSDSDDDNDEKDDINDDDKGDGDCDVWQGYATASLELPVSSFYFASLSVIMQQRDLRKNGEEVKQVTCTDANVISNVATAMQQNKNYVGECAGETWKVFKCDASTVFCLNCDGGCTTCPGTAYVINPCRDCKDQIYKSENGSLKILVPSWIKK